MAKIHGGQIVARALKGLGVDCVFTLTGGHIVPLLDGCMQEGIRLVDVRHEQAAGHAAEAYTRVTGKLGVAMVTAGPGVTDIVTAVATAFHANTPMLVIGGRHMVRQELKGGLQEMDHTRLFHSITRWAATAWQVDRLAEYIGTASRHAFSGRGGPVFLDIPMDVQFDMVEETAIHIPANTLSQLPSGADAVTLDRIAQTLADSERVMIFAGTGSQARSVNRLRELAELMQAPTFTNSSARGSLPYGHELLGNYARSQAMAGAEVVLALGVDWDFRTSYGDKIGPDATIIQVDAEPTKIGWNRAAAVGVVADPMTVVSQLADMGERLARSGEPVWTKEVMGVEREKAATVDGESRDSSTPIAPHRFAREVAEFFGPEAIVAADGGDIVSTTARWLQVSNPGYVLDPGPFGTLGVGAPYAIAAAAAHPDRLVGIVFGDGAFGFNGFEYDTMIRLGLPIIGVVGNDGVWNNIKTFHRLVYPDRLVATDLGVRPYHEMVRGLGGYGELVDNPDEITPALHRARESGLPSLINVHIAETMRMSSNYSQ